MTMDGGIARDAVLMALEVQTQLTTCAELPPPDGVYPNPGGFIKALGNAATAEKVHIKLPVGRRALARMIANLPSLRALIQRAPVGAREDARPARSEP